MKERELKLIKTLFREFLFKNVKKISIWVVVKNLSAYTEFVSYLKQNKMSGIGWNIFIMDQTSPILIPKPAPKIVLFYKDWNKGNVYALSAQNIKSILEATKDLYEL